MDIKNLVERDWAAELTSAAPVDLDGLTFHASLDSDQNITPSVVITADSKPLIESNHTYELNVQVILTTQTDDTPDALAIDYADQLNDFLTSIDFHSGLAARATSWQIVHLSESPTTDATSADGTRFIQRVQFRLIAQG